MAAAKIKGRRREQKRRKRHCQTRSSAGHPKRRKRKPNKKLYYAKSRFSIKRLNKILNSIEVVIHLPEAEAPFPKPPGRMYSYYQFRPDKVKVTREGYLKGGVLTFVFAWIDWSFLRDLAAPDYADSAEGGWLWDPVTLILLDFLREFLRRNGRADLLDELRDETPLGRQIAAYVGIDLDYPRHPDHVVPTEMAFTHLRQRLGPAVYEGMIHIVVSFLRQLEVITFGVLAFDSMLVDTWAVFNGCANAGQAGHGCQNCPLFTECQQVPFDLEGGVGHRVNPNNPKEVTPVFSHKVHSVVSFEVRLGMEFPVAILVSHGGAYDGHFFEALLEQIERYHASVQAIFHLADGHYDDFVNYIAARRRGTKPLFRYNKRNEKTDAASLRARGYNEVGWPYAPCGVAMTPNGYDEEEKRVTFVCKKQCPEDQEACPYRDNALGHAKSVKVEPNSRLVLEVPRDTRRYKIIFALRSSVERNNDYMADNGLKRPKYHGQHNMHLNALLTATATLLRKFYDLVVEATLQEAQPERYQLVDLHNLPLEQAIRRRWQYFRDEDEPYLQRAPPLEQVASQVA
jgi:hypothetical protein